MVHIHMYHLSVYLLFGVHNLILQYCPLCRGHPSLSLSPSPNCFHCRYSFFVFRFGVSLQFSSGFYRLQSMVSFSLSLFSALHLILPHAEYTATVHERIKKNTGRSQHPQYFRIISALCASDFFCAYFFAIVAPLFLFIIIIRIFYRCYFFVSVCASQCASIIQQPTSRTRKKALC